MDRLLHVMQFDIKMTVKLISVGFLQMLLPQEDLRRCFYLAGQDEIKKKKTLCISFCLTPQAVYIGLTAQTMSSSVCSQCILHSKHINSREKQAH